MSDYPSSLLVRPYTVTGALAFVREHHRRLPRVQGGLWAVRLLAPQLAGVAIVGRPSARALDNGERHEVRRVAVLLGVKNGCSKLYGATGNASRAMGATDCFTYIHDDETGISLRAAGWIEYGESDGGDWSCPSRPRGETVEPGAKRRFFAPWSEMLKQRHLKVAA